MQTGGPEYLSCVKSDGMGVIRHIFYVYCREGFFRLKSGNEVGWKKGIQRGRGLLDLNWGICVVLSIGFFGR